VDDLIVELRQSGYGLYTAYTFTEALLYVGDMALLACSHNVTNMSKVSAADYSN